ncbi:hypothetical protein ACB368_08735, partial [Escherichia coli]
TALSAEFTIGEGELMAHDVPLGCAPDEYDDLISGTCSHLPFLFHQDNTLFFNLHAVDPAGYDPRCNGYLSVLDDFSD